GEHGLHIAHDGDGLHIGVLRASRCIRVDVPEPDSPTTATDSPAWIWKVRPLSASNRDWPEPRGGAGAAWDILGSFASGRRASALPDVVSPRRAPASP